MSGSRPDEEWNLDHTHQAIMAAMHSASETRCRMSRSCTTLTPALLYLGRGDYAEVRRRILEALDLLGEPLE